MVPPVQISVIIINYRSAAFTRACLRSIYAQGPAQSMEVIVIDNATYDGCGEMMSAEYPQATFIQSAQNLGFAGANNLGISVSHGAHLLFLNPDTEIQGDAIGRLFEALAAMPEAGMVGARLLNSDLSVQTSSVTAFPSILNQILGSEYLRQKFPSSSLWGMKPLFEEHSEPVVVDAISGACMLARREVVEQVQGFTTDYFMYAEDLDLCVKVAKAGWKVGYVPDAVIVHHGGQSSGARSESNYADLMIRDSMYQFMEVHRGPAYAWMYRAATILAAACRAALLSLLLPVAVLTPKRARVIRAWKKWIAIVGWGAGIQGWVKRERTGPVQYPGALSPSESGSASK
ncbi:MAG: glycosyltransferase family 2 protein [Paludibaculum sp.]